MSTKERAGIQSVEVGFALLQVLGVQLGPASVTMTTVAIDTVRMLSMDLPPAP